MTAPDKAFEEWFESAYDTSCGVDEVMKAGTKAAWLASRKATLSYVLEEILKYSNSIEDVMSIVKRSIQDLNKE